MVCTKYLGAYGRVGVALPESLQNATSVTLSLFKYTYGRQVHFYSNVSMVKICDQNYLVPSWEIMNFPSGVIHYRVTTYHPTRIQHITFTSTRHDTGSVVLEMIDSTAGFELSSSGSSNTEIFVSGGRSLTFLLRNPTSFQTNFTLDGSLRRENGFEIGNTNLHSVVIYPEESLQIEVTINSGTAVVGSTNTFILHATNGCVDLYSIKNVTVIEQVSFKQ